MTSYMSKKRCTNCNTVNTGKGQWWHLSNYYGISGYFCPSCYDQVAHDSYGNPKKPTVFTKSRNTTNAIRTKRF